MQAVVLRRTAVTDPAAAFPYTEGKWQDKTARQEIAGKTKATQCDELYAAVDCTTALP